MKFEIGVVLGVVVACASPVEAYRPFDGTDADVVDVGEVEFEVSPVTWVREAGDDALVVPSLVVNVGTWSRWELVGEAEVAVDLDGDTDVDAAGANDAGVFLKGLLRPGSLQGRTGPSIATEFGALLPSEDPDHVGAAAALIVSQASAAVTLHGNLAASLTRSGRPGAFGSLILEGSLAWPVRPVAEVVVEEEFGGDRLVGGLGGLVWRVRDALSLDLAYHRGSVEGDALHEVRAGFTWAWRT
jgi:hypothetical protein